MVKGFWYMVKFFLKKVKQNFDLFVYGYEQQKKLKINKFWDFKAEIGIFFVILQPEKNR